MPEEQRHLRHGRKRHHHRHRSRREANGCHRSRSHNRQELTSVTQNSATNLLVNVSSTDINGEDAYQAHREKELTADILDDNESSTCDRNFNHTTPAKYLQGLARGSYTTYNNDRFVENDKKDFANHVSIFVGLKQQ